MIIKIIILIAVLIVVVWARCKGILEGDDNFGM
jgi:hypothetical protein